MKNRNIKHSDNWATPAEFYKILDDEFHFDFDPCPLNSGPISSEKDGLVVEWGNVNFVNPPYSRKLKEAFVKRAIEFSKIGKVSVCLLPASTSTILFHDYIFPNASEIRLVKGRIAFEGVNTYGKFVGKGSTPMHDSMVVVFGNKESAQNTKVILKTITQQAKPIIGRQ